MYYSIRGPQSISLTAKGTGTPSSCEQKGTAFNIWSSRKALAPDNNRSAHCRLPKRFPLRSRTVAHFIHGNVRLSDPRLVFQQVIVARRVLSAPSRNPAALKRRTLR